MAFNISIKRENLSFFKRNCQIKSKLLQIIVVLSCMCFVPSAVFATGLETGLFSNVKYSPMSGDVGGYELYIALSRKGYTAVLLDCQGECSPLEIVEPVFDGNKISFEHISLSGNKYTFKGEVDESGVRGDFHHPKFGVVEEVFLKRGQPYWNR